jgi:hypothetical protein
MNNISKHQSFELNSFIIKQFSLFIQQQSSSSDISILFSFIIKYFQSFQSQSKFSSIYYNFVLDIYLQYPNKMRKLDVYFLNSLSQERFQHPISYQSLSETTEETYFNFLLNSKFDKFL